MFNRILNDHASVCMMLLYVYFYSYVNVIVDLRLNKVYVRSFVRLTRSTLCEDFTSYLPFVLVQRISVGFITTTTNCA